MGSEWSVETNQNLDSHFGQFETDHSDLTILYYVHTSVIFYKCSLILNVECHSSTFKSSLRSHQEKSVDNRSEFDFSSFKFEWQVSCVAHSFWGTPTTNVFTEFDWIRLRDAIGIGWVHKVVHIKFQMTPKTRVLGVRIGAHITVPGLGRMSAGDLLTPRAKVSAPSHWSPDTPRTLAGPLTR